MKKGKGLGGNKVRLLNSVLLIIITIIYALVLTMTPLGAAALAGVGSEETEAETENIEETETEYPYSVDDFYELSHIIQAEAGYCSWDMMIGVGSVVLNRVKSDKYPNTVYEVIHQPGQYSTVSWLASQVPTEECEEVTDYLLRNGSQYP